MNQLQPPSKSITVSQKLCLTDYKASRIPDFCTGYKTSYLPFRFSSLFTTSILKGATLFYDLWSFLTCILTSMYKSTGNPERISRRNIKMHRNHTINKYKEQTKFASGDSLFSDITGKLCVHNW